jgi:AbrB family looped-hinge helix DNA binding protein
MALGRRERMQTAVDRFGRIVLPKQVRDALGMTPGTLLEIERSEGEVRLRPAVGEPNFVERGCVLVYSAPASAELGDAVRKHRDERLRRAGGSR